MTKKFEELSSEPLTGGKIEGVISYTSPALKRAYDDLQKYYAKLKKYLEEEEHYFNVRILPDGLVGCIDMIYTRAVVVGLTPFHYETRYCYEDKELAIKACDKLRSIDDRPIEGYKAIKGARPPWWKEGDMRLT